MSDVAQLLAEFMDELGRGRGVPEVLDFVMRAESDEDRRELAAQIDTALALASTELRWGTAERPADPADEALARSIVSAAFDGPRELAVLRERAGLSRDELAEAVLRESGLEDSGENRAGFRAWIEALESGARSVGELGGRALGVLAGVLNASAESIADADDGVLAFRASEEIGVSGDAVAAGIDAVAGALVDGMGGDEPTASPAVDTWFETV